MNFLLNEKTGAVLPWSPVLAARTRNQLKPISDVEARRRLGVDDKAPAAPKADAVEPAVFVDTTDPQVQAFESAKAKIAEFADKEKLDTFAMSEYSVSLDRRTSIEKMKGVLIAAVADTFGVAP